MLFGNINSINIRGYIMDAKIINGSNEFKASCRSVQEYWDSIIGMNYATIEEAAELIQSITKYDKNPSDNNLQNIIDEIGDMYISLKAIQYHYNISDEDINKRIDKKLNKKY